MEKQIEKFAKLCGVFDITVFDENPAYLTVVKDKRKLKVGKYRLGYDLQIIDTLKEVYGLFRKQEIEEKNFRKLWENNEKN